ncbi:PREDICTED: uncharacterized protein LOC109154044 [Ipomoea nil]|uniref:uncharacterized protein LOC109154044 n=1 Tax=Ipomoea nil TaxID=35883 RepID=UPI0009015161|nr:PREDICTED: uncharacterized protein LOC109154044 [Ipomoea nil]
MVEWAELFEEVLVRNLFTLNSYHSAIIIDTESRHVRAARRAFKFESPWLLKDGCAQVVDEAWRQSLGLTFQQRIELCGQRLGTWGGEHFQRFGNRIRFLRNRLDRLKEDRTSAAVDEFRTVEGELEILIRQEEIFWKQRSKQLWLQHGDMNTKYFHRVASGRRRRNLLLRMKDQSGTWREGTAMHSEILRYFDYIFCSNSSNPNPMNCVRHRVSNEMNVSLMRPFTIIEVKAALFSMAPKKAPGPDGMSPAFYQHFWPVLGHDMAVFILQCVASQRLPEGLNESNIVLLPKKKVPERVTDLRPIALCNVVYKVLAKMLANRLKICLEQVVSESHSAFVPERLLTDNVIVVGEVGHYLRRKTKGVVGWTALKLDMAKAYDRMEWCFLEGMLGALGFERRWVELLMMCVTTINYTIQVNGEAVGTVRPSRGIRQGDPLSPYLFIICAEGLSVLLQQAEARGDIHGVRVARGAPTVTHLFFADDSLLFFRANQQETLKVKECLDLYCAASGQLINFDKSNAVFSVNTTPAMRSLIANSLGVNEATDLGRYLGLPSALGRNKTAAFRYVEEKVRERIGSWQNKLLSRVGKEVLLKSIAQAMPIFTMSMFLLPLRVCDTIEKLFNRFWWGGGGTGTRGIHWLRWSKLCETKSRGGLGFKRLHEFNLALLAKQGWRILTNPESLGQKVLKLGLARRISDGLDTRIWDWPWLSDGTKPDLVTPRTDALQVATISGLFTSHGTWDTAILHDFFQEEDVRWILATPMSPQCKDSWRWLGDIRGNYTVRHGYRLLMNSSEENNYAGEFHAWNSLWSLPISPKAKNLLWHCARGVLPVRENLKLKHVWIRGGCPLCGHNWESMEHLFCECPYATALWEQEDVLNGRCMQLFMDQWLTNSTVEQSTRLAAIIWVVWSTRNDIVWRNIQPFVAAMRMQVSSVRACWEESNRRGIRDVDRAGHASTWEPPPISSVKCNVDAATFSDGAGYGAVIRDHNGRFIAAKNGRIMSNREPLMVEAIAAREALKWLKDLQYSNIIIESDCLNFCTAFNSRSRDFSYLDVIVKQCVSIANGIGNVSVCHVRRTANRVAHELARATGSSSVSGTWEFIPPACISGLLSY